AKCEAHHSSSREPCYSPCIPIAASPSDEAPGFRLARPFQHRPDPLSAAAPGGRGHRSDHMRAAVGAQCRARDVHGRTTMKTHATIALAILAGAGLGAGAVQVLHAQAQPPVYYIAEIDVTNPEAYAKEYVPKAQALIRSHGGRFLAVGGTGGTTTGK